MDKIIEKIVALGVPGLVLLVAIATTGLAGGAAVVAALALLGGPFGMLGGLALLGFMVLISKAIAEYGFEKIYIGVIAGLKEKGESKAHILAKIHGYPISKDLKRKLQELLEKAA